MDFMEEFLAKAYLQKFTSAKSEYSQKLVLAKYLKMRHSQKGIP